MIALFVLVLYHGHKNLKQPKTATTTVNNTESCTCMLLHGGVHYPLVGRVQTVVELLEGLFGNLFSKGMLELDAWVIIQNVLLGEC